MIDPDAAWLRLTYTASGPAIDYRVGLVATQPAYGGRRWWFVCPLGRKNGDPPRRVAKLYLPPGGRYFGSREAYGLTYTSCQESGKFTGLYRRLAADMGTDEATVRRPLKGSVGQAGIMGCAPFMPRRNCRRRQVVAKTSSLDTCPQPLPLDMRKML